MKCQLYTTVSAGSIPLSVRNCHKQVSVFTVIWSIRRHCYAQDTILQWCWWPAVFRLLFLQFLFNSLTRQSDVRSDMLDHRCPVKQRASYLRLKLVSYTPPNGHRTVLRGYWMELEETVMGGSRNVEYITLNNTTTCMVQVDYHHTH